MKFIQHIPLYERVHCAKMGVVPLEFEFTSLRDFNYHPFIRRLWDNNIFKRFTICRHGEYELIAELKNGHTFLIGVLEGNISEIPEWQSKENVLLKEIEGEKEEARKKAEEDARMGKIYAGFKEKKQEDTNLETIIENCGRQD